MKAAVIALAWCLLTAATAAAAAESDPATAPVMTSEPIHFTGERLTARRNEGYLRLDGDVHLQQGDSTLLSDQLEVYYGEDRKTISRLVASGHVRLIEPQRRGRADVAVYEPPSRKLTLTGNPSIWEGRDTLAGSKIVLYRDPDRVEVTAARAVVSPQRLQAAMAATAPAATTATTGR